MSSSVKQSAEESSPTESTECSTTTTNQSNKPNYSIDKLFDLKRFECFENVLKFSVIFKFFQNQI